MLNPIALLYRRSNGGKYRKSSKNATMHGSGKGKNTLTIKTDCKYQVAGRKETAGNGYQLQLVDNSQNHGFLAALLALPQYRSVTLTQEEHVRVKQMYLCLRTSIVC